jgi:hypothetical protein
MMMMPKPMPKPKPKAPGGGGPGGAPKAPGSGNPSALQPGLRPGAQDSAPNNAPMRLTGDPPPNPPKDPAPDSQNPSSRPQDNPDQKPKDDKKDEELQEPMLMEPMPPGPTTTDPNPTDPSQREPLSGDPGTNPENGQGGPSDADVAKQTENIWKVDNGAGMPVTPKQITDTMDATAKLKNIKQEGTWWSWSGMDIDASIQSNPKFVQNIDDAIVNHKFGSGPAAQARKRQSPDNSTQPMTERPESILDVVPGDARKHWQGMDTATNGTQSETSSRMSYAYATWIKGDNFYVISQPGVDVVDPFKAEGKVSHFHLQRIYSGF